MSIIFLTYAHIVQLIVLYTGSFQNFCIGGLDIAVCPDHIFALFHLPLLAASLIILFYHFCILSSFPKTGPKTKFSKSHHLQVPNPLSQNNFREPETRINPAFTKIFLHKKASRKYLFYFSLCPFAPSFDTFFVISFVKTGKALSIGYRDNPAATDYLFLFFFRTIFPHPSFFSVDFLNLFFFFSQTFDAWFLA